jgi:hypothetical protein
MSTDPLPDEGELSCLAARAERAGAQVRRTLAPWHSPLHRHDDRPGP